MTVWKRLAIFAGVGSASYVALSVLFGLYCILGGHDFLEMFYGGIATVVLAFVAGVEFAWLAPASSGHRH